MRNTTLCYIENNNKYLMLHRTKKANDQSHGKWLGIGGKFEDKESPDECLLREVYEETGLKLTSYRLRGIVTFISDVDPAEYMHLFTTDSFHGQIIDCDEGKLEWYPIDKIDELELWEGDKIFFRLLRENAPFFSLKLVYKKGKLIEAVLNGKKLTIGNS